MANLTQTAYLSRKAINIGIMVLILGIILRILFGYAQGLWQKYFPPPPPPATLAFGKLPFPNAENNVATPSGLTFRLETVDGSLPAAPPTLNVYHMPRPGPSFGSFQKMTTQAQKLGFVDAPRKLTSTAWRFTDATNPLRSLDIDEVTGNFRITYNYLSDQTIFRPGEFSSEEQVTAEARSFFSRLGTLPTDLEKGTPEAFLFRLDAGALVPATSLSNAEAISVNLNREPIDKLPVLSPNLRQGLVSVLFSSSSESDKRVLEARYFYSVVDLENWASYPVFPTSEAFDSLKNGQAIYLSLPTTLPSEFVVRKVYLAYLDPYPPQAFLEPVWVFSDDRGLVAAVPAVSRQWLE